MLENYQNVTETESEQMLLKSGTDQPTFLDARMPQTFNS